MTDEEYMRRCLQLAEKGFGEVSPNPMVGAVIVCGDEVIGEGYHQKYGGPQYLQFQINHFFVNRRCMLA